MPSHQETVGKAGGPLEVSLDISVVLCTHNQADYLNKALTGLVSQSLPRERFEIIVVDNASQDHTQDIIRDFNSVENLRCLYEPNLGLSIARNQGWQKALGDYVAFLDSDAIPSRDWLARIQKRFALIRPKPAAVGGRIVPIWEGRRPDWLSRDLEPFLGIIDWSDESFIIGDENPYYLAGSNIAYRRDVLRMMNGFSVSLGRRGQRLLSNEEILLQKKATHLNLFYYYDPDIYVHHHVKSECLRKRWFYRRLFWQGISDVVLEYELLSMKGGNWRFFPHIRGDGSSLFSETILCFKRIVRRSRAIASSNFRILYWVGRLFSDLRMMVDWD